ncbi:MAG TPA: AAA family ATPase [Pseudomonadales bacterium]|jgi:DNA polymerase-3 subunit delta'|nr:AAA family ATPase [Pseudomonadales bacterium]
MRLPPWLEGFYASLVTALDGGRLPHALLIHGPGGWGETVLAEALALRLIERASESSAATIAHPDLRWIVPEGAGEQIGIDAVRAVADFIVRTPQIAPRKVAVITNADALNPHAANALLKTLEEPPPDSFLILVSDSLRELLPTLRSRCRLLPVRPPVDAAALHWIGEQMPTTAAEQIAALYFEYGGAPYRVVAAIERDEKPIAETLHAVALGEANALNVADVWAKDMPAELVERWMRYLARLLGQRRMADRQSAPDDPLARVLAKATDSELLRLWDELARDRLLLRGTTNPNARLLFESRLLAWKDLAIAV